MSSQRRTAFTPQESEFIFAKAAHFRVALAQEVQTGSKRSSVWLAIAQDPEVKHRFADRNYPSEEDCAVALQRHFHHPSLEKRRQLWAKTEATQTPGNEVRETEERGEAGQSTSTAQATSTDAASSGTEEQAAALAEAAHALRVSATVDEATVSLSTMGVEALRSEVERLRREIKGLKARNTELEEMLLDKMKALFQRIPWKERDTLLRNYPSPIRPRALPYTVNTVYHALASITYSGDIYSPNSPPAQGSPPSPTIPAYRGNESDEE
ncbi:hypothetical protein WJX72_000060 [[Myrmecia] bisecta]|uniref:Transposase n=1 Tax=[Myrmecia] bisecta TaxID=41462 RepID=A0AAW1QNU9_9CHLO